MPRALNLANVQQYTAINLLVDPGSIGGPLIIPTCAQIRLRWNAADGKVVFNTLVGRYAGAFSGSQTQANAILTALTTGAQWTALAGFLSSQAALTGVDIRDINTANQPIVPSSSLGANGTSAGVSFPSEVAVCLTLRTAFTGPANRGRLYIPAWAANAQGTGDTIAAAAVTAAGNWGSIIAGVLSAQGYTWCVGHPARAAYTGITGTQHPARVAGSVPITTVSVRDNHWDSQRRRGLK
jgi:hypothetical protein